jgi:hypothetical protein
MRLGFNLVFVPRRPSSVTSAKTASIKSTGAVSSPEKCHSCRGRDAPVAGEDGHIAETDGGLIDREWVARVLGRPVVKAFNNILAESLATRGVPAGAPARICLSVAGDDPRAKELVL